MLTAIQNIKNEKLESIVNWACFTDAADIENPEHLRLLVEACVACDDKYMDRRDVQDTLDDIFEESELCGNGEQLKDVLSLNICTRLQEIKSITRWQ